MYFRGIWYIIWPFGNVLVIRYIFPCFGILREEKSGNPVRDLEPLLMHQNRYQSESTSFSQNFFPPWSLPIRVTRFGDFLHIYVIICFKKFFLKMTKVAHIFGYSFPQLRLSTSFGKMIGLHFFTNSSGHLAANAFSLPSLCILGTYIHTNQHEQAFALWRRIAKL
jgi:hypothetical protein